MSIFLREPRLLNNNCFPFFSFPGVGNDSHSQSLTKAAIQACWNAVEFNSLPSISNLVPGGYDNMKLSVILAVPPTYQCDLDLDQCTKVFPYGNVQFMVQDGVMVAPIVV